MQTIIFDTCFFHQTNGLYQLLQYGDRPTFINCYFHGYNSVVIFSVFSGIEVFGGEAIGPCLLGSTGWPTFRDFIYHQIGGGGWLINAYDWPCEEARFINCTLGLPGEKLTALLQCFNGWHRVGHWHFKNCKVNFNDYSYTANANGHIYGSTLTFEHYNQVEGDTRVWHYYLAGSSAGGWDTFEPNFIEYKDNAVYRTEGPSIKLVKPGNDSASYRVPFKYPANPISIPAVKGSTYRITAYLRKDSAWGDCSNAQIADLPIMRVHYQTGSVGSDMVRHTVDVEMEDVTDEWAQVQTTVTHNFNTPILLEFVFWTTQLDATIWIDDITVEEV